MTEAIYKKKGKKDVLSFRTSFLYVIILDIIEHMFYYIARYKT